MEYGGRKAIFFVAGLPNILTKPSTKAGVHDVVVTL